MARAQTHGETPMTPEELPARADQQPSGRLKRIDGIYGTPSPSGSATTVQSSAGRLVPILVWQLAGGNDPPHQAAPRQHP